MGIIGYEGTSMTTLGTSKPDSDRGGVADELDNCPATPNTSQEDGTLNGIGDACETPGQKNATAGFLQALSNGSTFAEATSLGITAEPGIVERLMELVREGKQQAWWQSYDLDWATYVGLEQAATTLCYYQSTIVPGLTSSTSCGRISVSNCSCVKIPCRAAKSFVGLPPREDFRS